MWFPQRQFAEGAIRRKRLDVSETTTLKALFNESAAKLRENSGSFFVPAAVQTNDLLLLAQSRSPADREKLMMAITELAARENGKTMEAEAVQELMNSIFLNLVSTAEREIRKALSERLADAAWAPYALVNVLALDEIEIARPIIAQSPVLKDEDLVRVMAMATLDHQVEVAARPCIGGDVIEAILKQADPAVMTALAGNDTADISPQAMQTLIAHSKDVASLRSPLVRHPRLTTEMAERLYVWVGQSLRSAIVSRFRVDADALDREIAKAVQSAQSPSPASAGPGAAPRPATGPATEDRRQMEMRLVSKLNASGQLRPGYLIKSLRDQRLSLFCAALAELIGVPIETIETAISAHKPDLLALACTAAGVDQSAFPTILYLVRDLNRQRPGGGAEEGRRAMSAFASADPELALMALRRGVAA